MILNFDCTFMLNKIIKYLDNFVGLLVLAFLKLLSGIILSVRMQNLHYLDVFRGCV